MRRRWPAAFGLALFAGWGCAELVGTAQRSVSLSIIPVFNVADPYAVTATTADSLEIVVIQRDDSGAFADTVAQETVAIDPDSGTANTTLTIPLVTSPQSFVVLLRAVRSADGLVLFSGADTIQVRSDGQGAADSIPITYTGPRAARLTIAPKDTAVTGAAVIPFGVTAFDSSDAVVSGVYITFHLANPADSAKLALGKYTGIATVVSGATGQVGVYALAPGGVSSDTATVSLGAVPAAIVVTPGYANLAAGDTLTLTGQVVDAGGNPISAGGVTWQSRATGIATVSAAGLVSGVTPGTAVLVASGFGFRDSALVTVAAPTNVIVSTTSQGRGFGLAKVGDTIVVAVTADMQFTPNELLGSYNATLNWNPGTLQFIDVTGMFGSGAFTPNATSVGAGVLQFASIDANGAGGAVSLAQVRFRALAAGTTSPTVTVTEMSAAGTFTNLLATGRVAVTNGFVTVAP